MATDEDVEKAKALLRFVIDEIILHDTRFYEQVIERELTTVREVIEALYADLVITIRPAPGRDHIYKAWAGFLN